MKETEFVKHRLFLLLMFLLPSCAILQKENPIDIPGPFLANLHDCGEVEQIISELECNAQVQVSEGSELISLLSWKIEEDSSFRISMRQDSGTGEDLRVKCMFIRLGSKLSNIDGEQPVIEFNAGIVQNAFYVDCEDGAWLVILFDAENGVFWFEGTEILRIQPAPQHEFTPLDFETIVMAENLDGKTS